MYSTASIGCHTYTWRVPWDFHKLPPPRWNTPSKVHAVSTNPDVLPSPSFNGIKGLTEF